jgi:hypothetical protein
MNQSIFFEDIFEVNMLNEYGKKFERGKTQPYAHYATHTGLADTAHALLSFSEQAALQRDDI